MSSDVHTPSTSRNLIRVSGPGYRESIELQQVGDRQRQAEIAVGRFQAGYTGAGITLSRIGDQRLKSLRIDIRAVKPGTTMTSLLSERRDTTLPPNRPS
jgi:hypothetical protein